MNPALNELAPDMSTWGQDKILKWLRDAEVSTPETIFRTQAMESYRFYAGKQDTREVLAKLANDRRPNSTYNEVKPKIDMLIGLAAQTKHDPVLNPVGVEDEPLAELMTNALKHFRGQMKLARKELECFEHTVKSGRSLLHFYIDKENPFEPKLCAKRFAGRHFYIDPQSVEYDLSDARFVFLESWLPEDEIKNRWKNFDISQYQQWTSNADLPTFHNEARDLYRIVECWYTEYVEVAWFINPINGKPEYLLPNDFKIFAKALREGLPLGPQGELKQFEVPEIVLGMKKQYKYRIFSGSFVMEEGVSPYKFEGYPCVLYGAYKNEDDNTWFSVIEMMKDPQRAVNTMKRQLQHLLQTLPKGILKHEVGSIANIEEYEQRSSDPSFHLEINPGFYDKVGFEKQPPISPVYTTFGEECSQSMKDTSGIQNEMMGVQTSSREPGVTVRARQETNLAVLYTLYDNFKESRMAGSKIEMHMIQQYVTQPTMIRIQGDAGSQLIAMNTQLNPGIEGYNDISTGKYDLVTDERMESSTSRLAMLQMLMDFNHNNPGTIPADLILEYSDIPFSMKQQIKQYTRNVGLQRALEADRTYELELLKIEQKVDAVGADVLIEKRKAEIARRAKEASDEGKSRNENES